MKAFSQSTSLVQDCILIIRETRFKAGGELLLGYVKLGRRVLADERRPTLVKLAEEITAEGEPISSMTLSTACRIAKDPKVKELKTDDSIKHVLQDRSVRSYFREWTPPRTLPEHSPIPLNSIRNEGVIEGDFRDSDLPEESVHLILTDPPYGENYLHLWDDLGKLASRVLVPGGWLASYSGQAYLPQVLTSLSNHLTYHWIIALKLANPNGQIFARRIMNWWKPILIFAKPPIRQTWLRDYLEGEGREKTFHKWQQNMAESRTLIEWLTEPGDTVLDPMAGSGTTVEACRIDPTRKVIAFEIQKIPTL